jgi:hypothetical protein
MNLSFELQNNKALRDDGEFFRPFKIVSLWDIMRKIPAQLLELFRMLGVGVEGDQCLRQVFKILDEIEQKCDARIERNGVELHALLKSRSLEETLSGLRDIFIKLELKTSAAAAINLIKLSRREDKKLKDEKFWSMCEEILRVCKSELDTRLMFILEPTHAAYYDMKGTILGQNVIDEFPFLQVDAEEAGNCFAFENYTACVFHLMRIMEMITKNLAPRFKIKPLFPDLKEKTWGKLVGEIDNQVKKLKDDTLKQKEKKEKFRHSCALLEDVCRVTRNPLMHANIIDIKPYNKKQAKDTMDRIVWFMEEFVKLPKLTKRDFK